MNSFAARIKFAKVSPFTTLTCIGTTPCCVVVTIPASCGKGQGAVARWALGYPDQAAQSAREGIVLAEGVRHVPSVLHSLWFAAAVCHLRQDVATVRACSERLLTVGREHGLKQYHAIGRHFPRLDADTRGS